MDPVSSPQVNSQDTMRGELDIPLENLSSSTVLFPAARKVIVIVFLVGVCFGVFHEIVISKLFNAEYSFAFEMVLGDLAYIVALAFLFHNSNISYSYFLNVPTKPLPVKLMFNWTLFLMCLSYAAYYVLWLPVSYVVPDFVQSILSLTVDIFPSFESGEVSVLASVVMFIVLVITAPLFEELLFRGLLLRRWMTKYSRTKAILLSSALFGILHVDPLGAFFFAVAMCLLYLHTGSLWVTVACHALNNFVVWLIVYTDTFLIEFLTLPSVDTIQANWHRGLTFVLLSTAWYLSIKRSSHDPMKLHYQIQ